MKITETATVSGFIMYNPERKMSVINTFRPLKAECVDVAKEVMPDQLLSGEWVAMPCVTRYEVQILSPEKVN